MNAHKRDVRAERFHDLLATVDVPRLSSIFMFDLGTGEVDLQLPRQCLSLLLKTWRESQKSATAYGYPERVLIWGCDRASNRHMVTSVPQLLNREKIQFPVSDEYYESAVVLKGIFGY